jgi:hypothetical protein
MSYNMVWKQIVKESAIALQLSFGWRLGTSYTLLSSKNMERRSVLLVLDKKSPCRTSFKVAEMFCPL